MNFRVIAIFAFVSLNFVMGSVSHACMGGSYKLNDDFTLFGDEVRSESGQAVETKKLVGRYLNVTDKKDIKTHSVLVMGIVADDDGIMATYYLVKNLNDNTEMPLKVSTNYAGKGIYARGLGSDDKIQTNKQFSSLREVGCSGK